MFSILGRELQQLRDGDHVAVFADGDATWDAAVRPFVAHAIARGEAVIALASPLVAARLAPNADGRLTITSDREPLLRRWSFSAEALFAMVRESVRRTGAHRAHCVFDVAWILGDAPRPDQIVGYEARLDRFVRETQSTVLAWYDRRILSTALVAQCLRTHPLVVVDDALCENVYHDPPNLVLHEHDLERRLRQKLERLKAARGGRGDGAGRRETMRTDAAPARGAA